MKEKIRKIIEREADAVMNIPLSDDLQKPFNLFIIRYMTKW